MCVARNRCVRLRLDSAFFKQHSHGHVNTIRDHRETKLPRKNQQKIQTAAVGWLPGCARRGGESAAAAAEAARGEPVASAPPRGTGRGGVKRARRLWVRDKIVRRLDGVAHSNHSFSLRPRIFFTARPHVKQYDMGSQST